MSEERLEINETEARPGISKTAGKSAKEILGSLELAVDFMEGIPKDKRYIAGVGLLEDFLRSNGPEIDALAEDREAVYIGLIQKGLDGLFESRKEIMEESELTEDEKKEKILRLNKMYQCAEQLRQMARAQAMDRLLADFLNPYLLTAQGGEIYNYDAGFATATTWDEKTGKYKSRWEPKVHFHRQMGKFLSESDISNIQKFIEGFFEQHHQVGNLVVKIEEKLGRKIDDGYDPRAAEVVLAEFDRLPASHRLSDHTRMVVSSHAISVILSDYDYKLIKGVAEDERLKSSGGVHFSGTVLNLIKGHFKVAEKICHENEHALNDNLLGLHQTDLEEEARWRISLLGLTTESGGQELEKIFEQLIQDLLNNELGHYSFFTRFADEVLAYKLGDKASNESILDTLNNSELYHYLNVTDEKVGSLYQGIANDMERCLQGFRGGRRLRAQPGVLQKMEGQIPNQLYDFLRRKDVFAIKSTVQKLLDKSAVYKMREDAVKQIDRLIKAEFTPEKIRALLSTNNPLTWKDIVATALARVDVLESDRNDIRIQLKKRAEKTIDRARTVSFEDASRYGELSDEQKKSFREVRDVVIQLATRGFELKESYYKSPDYDYENYTCYLRKINGKNSHHIAIYSSIEHDPKSGKTQKYTTLKIDVERNKNFKKEISFEDNNGFTLQNVETAIEEAEKEANS